MKRKNPLWRNPVTRINGQATMGHMEGAIMEEKDKRVKVLTKKIENLVRMRIVMMKKKNPPQRNPVMRTDSQATTVCMEKAITEDRDTIRVRLLTKNKIE